MKSLSEPWIPAALLFQGMIFVFALTDLADVAMSPWLTTAFYIGLTVWVTGIAVWRKRDLFSASPIDLLFIGFLATILLSILTHGDWSNEKLSSTKFVPFLVVCPYVCGKMLSEPERARFIRLMLLASILLIALMLVDFLLAQSVPVRRWTFFGVSHTPLLVGSLLSTALVALLAGRQIPTLGQHELITQPVLRYGVMIVLSACLILVMARGWLLAVAGASALLAVAQLAKRERVVQLAAGLGTVAATMLATFAVLTAAAREFVARMVTSSAEVIGNADASCASLVTAQDSISIRITLYREAIGMFGRNPLFGVGAGEFGAHSCVGLGGFPHSTLLQAYAELGIVGGGFLTGALVMSLVVLFRATLRWQARSTAATMMALLVLVAIADQFYGNYFMSSAASLFMGIASGIMSQEARNSDLPKDKYSHAKL